MFLVFPKPTLMAIKYYLRKRVKHIWSRFKWLIILYFLFFLIWLFIKIFPNFFINLFEGTFGFNKGFFDAWYPTLTEDIFFFGLGFIGLVISTKLLRDESFEVRVSSLANGKHTSESVDVQLKTEIQKLLSINKKYSTVIELKEIDPTGQYIFVHVYMTCIVVNLCEEDTIPTYIKTFVEPGPQILGRYGTINTHIVTKKTKKGKVKAEYIIPKGHDLDLNTLKGNNYEYSRDYFILGNGKAKWELAFQVWVPYTQNKQQKSNWLFNNFNGYTENYALTLINKSGKKINFEYKYIDRLTSNNQHINLQNQILDIDERRELVSGLIFHRGDNFEIYFS